MATNQAFLDGLRAQAGMGMSYARPSAARSNDQNMANTGNPGTSANMSWQQQAAMRANNGRMLAQDPTNIRYTQAQQAANSQAYQGSAQQAAAVQAAQQQQPNMNGWLSLLGNIHAPGMPSSQQMGSFMGAPSGGFIAPRGFTPDNMAQRNVVGSRFVRPMVR